MAGRERLQRLRRAPAAALRRLGIWLSRPAGVVLALALAALAVMYFSNSDWGGNKQAPRGDGTYRPVLARGDGHMMFMMTQSLVLDGDLHWDDELAAFGDPWNQPRTATGRKMIPHPIGPSLIWAPAFTVAHGVAKTVNLLGAEVPDHGYTIVHQRITFFLSVLFGWGAALLGFLVARRWVGGAWGPLYGAVAVLFGTTLTYYATYMPSYAHAMDAFACAGFLAYWALTLGDTSARRFVILGVLLGLCALVRVTGFSMGVVVAIELAGAAWRAPPVGRSRARHVLFLGARGATSLGVAIAVFTPQLVAWKIVFGEWVTSPMGPAFMRLDSPQIWETLFASRNGWLSTHPIAYAGLVGLLFVPRRARVIAIGLAAAVAMQVWINAAVFDWWAGASLGQRRMASVTLILVVGLAALLRAAGIAGRRLPLPVKHGLAILILGWFVLWNLIEVQKLRRGRAANSAPHPMCCGQVPGFMRAIAKPIYETVGNPFALPASGIFALRYDQHPKTWDLVAGNYADFPDLGDMNDGTFWRRIHKWNLPGVNFAPYLTGGFGPHQRHGTYFRWTVADRAGALVPLYLGVPHRFTVPVFANAGQGQTVRVKVRFNGAIQIDRELGPGWHQLDFDVAPPILHTGMNELEIEAEPRPHALGPDPKNPRALWLPPDPKGRPVGAAVGQITIAYPPRESQP